MRQQQNLKIITAAQFLRVVQHTLLVAMPSMILKSGTSFYLLGLSLKMFLGLKRIK